MRPLDVAQAAERQEPALPLTGDRSPGASEEPAAADAAGTPGRGWCWLCRSSPCGSRVQSGECRVRTRARVSPLEGPGRRQRGDPRSRRLGRIADRAPHPHPAQSSGKPGAVTWGTAKLKSSVPPAGAKTRESFRLCLETFLDSKTVPIIKVLRARLWSQIAVQRSRPEVRGWGVSEKSQSLAAYVGRKHTLKTDLGGKPEEEV